LFYIFSIFYIRAHIREHIRAKFIKTKNNPVHRGNKLFNYQENTERDAPESYDYHLLQGHIQELDVIDDSLLDEKLVAATSLLEESKTKKGQDKTLAQIDALILFSQALALMNKCIIDDDEALMSLLCVRLPELEFDFATLQKMLKLKKKIMDAANSAEKIEEDKTLNLAITLYTSALLEALKKRVK
jgi:hypothetical protein